MYFFLLYALSIILAPVIAVRHRRWIAVPLIVCLPIVGFLLALRLKTRCPFCREYMSPGAKVCPWCGHNIATGAVKVAVEWGDNPATDKQLGFIRHLGGNPPNGLTKSEASDMIDALLVRKRGRT